MAERTAKEKVVDGIYAAWGGGKFNDPATCDAEFVKYFTEDAFFKCTAPQVRGAASPFGLQPVPFARFFACALPGLSVDACALCYCHRTRSSETKYGAM